MDCTAVSMEAYAVIMITGTRALIARSRLRMSMPLSSASMTSRRTTSILLSEKTVTACCPLVA